MTNKFKFGNFEIKINQNELFITNGENIILSAELNNTNKDEISAWVDYNFTKNFEFNSSELKFIVKNKN